MGGDPLKKVRPGDPLQVPAAGYNAMVDAARAEKMRRQGIERSARAGFRQTGIVLVKNNSGADRDRFNVLGIDGPIFTPAEGLDSFKNDQAFKGITPATADHLGNFVILLEPIESGKIGPAVASGVCPVRVNVTDESHGYADVADGQAGYLASGASGAARILCVESGTGEKWAKVRIGAGGGGDVSGAHTLLDATAHTDTVADTVSVGSLIVGNSNPDWDELDAVISTPNRVLVCGDSGAPFWEETVQLS